MSKTVTPEEFNKFFKNNMESVSKSEDGEEQTIEHTHAIDFLHYPSDFWFTTSGTIQDKPPAELTLSQKNVLIGTMKGRLHLDDTIYENRLLAVYLDELIKSGGNSRGLNPFEDGSASCFISLGVAYIYAPFLWKELISDIISHNVSTFTGIPVTEMVFISPNALLGSVECLHIKVFPERLSMFMEAANNDTSRSKNAEI
ncbi:hypothetical protein KW882_00555 [Vibrio parahaemolyticus]